MDTIGRISRQNLRWGLQSYAKRLGMPKLLTSLQGFASDRRGLQIKASLIIMQGNGLIPGGLGRLRFKLQNVGGRLVSYCIYAQGQWGMWSGLRTQKSMTTMVRGMHSRNPTAVQNNIFLPSILPRNAGVSLEYILHLETFCPSRFFFFFCLGVPAPSHQNEFSFLLKRNPFFFL